MSGVVLELTLKSDFHNVYALCSLSIDTYSTAHYAWKIKRRNFTGGVIPLAEAEELF
jgi:hypothetical protein